MHILSRCCCIYEVPYRGVSMVNPSGHLAMALRNEGEKQTFGDYVKFIFKKGLFHISENQLNLFGVLGLSHWELIFVPCINQDFVDDNEFVKIRYGLFFFQIDIFK